MTAKRRCIRLFANFRSSSISFKEPWLILLPPSRLPLPKRQRTQGFTLVEISISMAIAAVLMVLLLVGYRSATQTALGVKNLSQHKEISRALLDYAAAHQGYFPWTNDYNPPFGKKADGSFYNSHYPKTLAILGYITDGRVFFSPKFLPRWGRSEDRSGMYQILQDPKKFPGATIPWAYPSYAANRYGAMPVSTDKRKPAQLTQVGRDGNLSKLMLIRDAYTAAQDTPERRLGGGQPWFSNENYLPPPEDCYRGMVYASFADGHVEAFPRETMVEMMKSGAGAPLFSNYYTK